MVVHFQLWSPNAGPIFSLHSQRNLAQSDNPGWRFSITHKFEPGSRGAKMPAAHSYQTMVDS
jgi:hypothetical protein